MANIDFTSAMQDFKTMFPDMDADVIEEVLRSNRGSVERTIDQLLAIASDNQNEKFMRDDDVSDKKPTQNIKPLVKPEMKSESSVRWKPVLLPLEPHFLRLSTDPEYSEEFAVMLQNEEFLTQLRFNQEFLSTLESEGRTDDRSFEDRLKHMGKVSRKKFQQLARVFTFQKKKNVKPKNKLLEQESETE